MRLPSLPIVALSLAGMLSLDGCGYHVGEIRPTPMRRVSTIAVNTFKNNMGCIRRSDGTRKTSEPILTHVIFGFFAA